MNNKTVVNIIEYIAHETCPGGCKSRLAFKSLASAYDSGTEHKPLHKRT